VRFLVIEDDPGHALLISKVLGELFPGCTIDHKEDLAHITGCQGKEEYTVVLSDLSLPDAEGLEAVRIIREQLPTPPVIVLTSLQDESVALEALEHGVEDYLSKQEILTHGSAGGDKLRRSIQYAIQRQESRKENQLLVIQLLKSQELLEKKNRRLEQLFDASQRFVDNVSHEFRTPLTVIKEYSSLIRDGIVGEVNEDQVGMLNVIDDRTDDLNTMVDDLLDSSRLEAGLMGLCRQECNFNEIVDYLMPSVRRKAVVRNVSLEIDIPPSLPFVWCDREKIGRIMINLVVNAIKFCGEPGLVRISAVCDDVHRQLVVGVSDNGPGIPVEKLDEIFNRFEQHVTSVRQSTKGFGLGLGIAKELVDLNLGRMEVQSESGKGSTFRFTIPYAEYVGVLRRQFTRLRTEKPESAEICLASIVAEDGGDKRDLMDLEMLLQQDLRTHDQLFRVDDRHWLVILAISPLEFSAFTNRLENDRREISRNRPKGNLPSLDIDYSGNWQLSECEDEEILSEVRRRYGKKELAHA
jgi:signal transduction histidine kinase